MRCAQSLAVAVIAVLVCDSHHAEAELTFSEPILLDAPFNVSSSSGGTAATTTFNKGLAVILESDRPGGFGNGDLWELRRASSDAPWGEPVNLGENVNTAYWDAHPTVTSNGLHLVFCDLNPFGDPGRPSGLGAFDLYMASRSSLDEPFGPATMLLAPISSAYIDGTPGMSGDGLELYFASFRPGGQGQADIWVSTRQSLLDPWGDPVNLGGVVNSPYTEEGPNLSTDGLSLLFVVNRPGGVGSFDLWMSSRSTTDAPWLPPVHLGNVINSENYENFPDASDDFPAMGSTLRFSASDSPSPDATWSVYESVVLAGAVEGDFTGDGIVDGQDFLRWQRGVLPDPLSPNDLASWEANFGSSQQSFANSRVPEPATFALAALIILVRCRHGVNQQLAFGWRRPLTDRSPSAWALCGMRARGTSGATKRNVQFLAGVDVTAARNEPTAPWRQSTIRSKEAGR